MNLKNRVKKVELAGGNGFDIKFFFISEDGTIEHQGKIITPEEYAAMTEGATDVINFIDPPRNNPYK